MPHDRSPPISTSGFGPRRARSCSRVPRPADLITSRSRRHSRADGRRPAFAARRMRTGSARCRSHALAAARRAAVPGRSGRPDRRRCARGSGWTAATSTDRRASSARAGGDDARAPTRVREVALTDVGSVAADGRGALRRADRRRRPRARLVDPWRALERLRAADGRARAPAASAVDVPAAALPAWRSTSPSSRSASRPASTRASLPVDDALLLVARLHGRDRAAGDQARLGLLKRMWVHPDARGPAWAAACCTSSSSARRRLWSLETNRSLTEAIASPALGLRRGGAVQRRALRPPLVREAPLNILAPHASDRSLPDLQGLRRPRPLRRRHRR